MTARKILQDLVDGCEPAERVLQGLSKISASPLIAMGEHLEGAGLFEQAAKMFGLAVVFDHLSPDILLAKLKNQISAGIAPLVPDLDALQRLNAAYYRYVLAMLLARRPEVLPSQVLEAIGNVFESFPAGSQVDWLYLRQIMASKKPEPAVEAKISCIPRRLHFYWDKNPPDEIKENIEYHNSISGFETISYNKESASEFLYQFFGSDVNRLFLKSKHPSEESDFFRYHLIYAQGGYYLDVDEQVVSGEILLNMSGAADGLYIISASGPVENSFFGSIAQSPVMEECLRIISYNCMFYPDLSIWLKTGPGVLTRAIARCYYRSMNLGMQTPMFTLREPPAYGQILRAVDVSYRNDTRDWRVFEREKSK